MRLNFLGTGTIVPNFYRSSSSYLLSDEQLKILIDIGPGVLNRLISNKINPMDLDFVLLTHFHMDHISDLLALFFLHKYPPMPKLTPTTIVCHPRMQELMKPIEHLLGFKLSNLQYVQWKWCEPLQSFRIDENLVIETLPMNHKQESLGYLFRMNKINLFVSGDTDKAPGLLKGLNESDTAVIECSHSEHVNITGHLNVIKLREVLEELIEKRGNLPQIYLSHFYPDVENSLMLNQLLLNYPELHIAKDNDSIILEEV